MLWLKAFHIISVVAWFAGLFYLPRLFVYHSMTKSESCRKMLKIMEHKLFYYIMNPALVSTVSIGLILLFKYSFYFTWMYAKMVLTVLLITFHLYLKSILDIFARNSNKKSHKFYRIINEVPTILLIFIVILVVLKPF